MFRNIRRFISISFFVVPMVIRILRARLVRRYVVEGRSMLGSFTPGDRLVAEALTYRVLPPRVGDAVIVRQPGAGKRLDLKRIAAVPGTSATVRGEQHTLGDDEWYVLGDNADESRDSRQLGPVKREDIVARVWFKY